MEAVSEGENKGFKGESRPKRQMKTPFQLETLEKTYALDAYPCEAVRVKLSEKLGLTDRQLQMWFCHRRLKDKKDASAKSLRIPPLLDSPKDETMRLDERGSDPRSGSMSGSLPESVSGSGSSPVSYREPCKVMPRRVGMKSMMVDDDMPPMSRVCRKLLPPLSELELSAIALVEAQLGEPIREDGPILGMEFDSLPPDAFGQPIASLEQKKQHGSPYMCKIYERHDAQLNKATARPPSEFHKKQSLGLQPSMTSDMEGVVIPHVMSSSFVHGDATHDDLSPEQDEQDDIYSSSSGDYKWVPRKNSFTDFGVDPPSAENLSVSPDCQLSLNEHILRMRSKRKIEEVKMGWEDEAHKKRIRKELKKEDNLRQNREEQVRKEMKRRDHERRKEEERSMREKQREEEKLQREQRREVARREKLLLKESLKEEKRKQKEELQKEKEVARRKAATERATARRIARESMGLIDDEQLELMELASSRKGLHSINYTEQNTMQNLDSLGDLLSVFPSKSVKLKRPFAVQPWLNSEENIGNLLMVWRFLISFADVLELWPFTLDEFVQAFHDSDSRLLCEVHVGLLKQVIKDIEAVGAEVSQNSSSKSEGGHQSIVEGAYAWGFDILSWQHHLNALTWPEIFRQLALSAGFGPQLKKINTEPACLHDNNEGLGCGDLVSTLRNGSAAESAAAMMKEKGFSFVRRCRHLLTPGTVKFAAFHVLSLEGSRGITILELADKIQKSGLRDLTMSKAPEASIAAALSRDAKLFERTAPSTYCVRSPFRKDPADADSVLSSAREKLRISEGVSVAGEDADVLERDEESDCDVAEGSEVEDVVRSCSVSGKDNFRNDFSVSMQNGSYTAQKGSSSLLDSSKDADCATVDHIESPEGIVSSNTNPEWMEIDESKSYEPWVQGLAEGEYSALSVEERLNSLVSLVSIVNEGKSIRTVLEKRLEAANALKKQMWAEAQLDKKHAKEDSRTILQLPSFIESETKFASSATNCCQSPSLDRNCNEASLSATAKEEHFVGPCMQNNFNSSSTERNSVDKFFPMGMDNLSYQYDKYAAERLQAQLKSYVANKAEEIYVYRSLPLGQDRRRNRYWQFVASASINDPGAGRIFIELHDGHWRLIDSEEAFDALKMSLDARGVREYSLLSVLCKVETSFKESVRKNSQCTSVFGHCETDVTNGVSGTVLSPSCIPAVDSPQSMVCSYNSNMLESSSFKTQLGRNEAEDKASLKRCQDFQRWAWRDCFHSLTSCGKRYGKKSCKQVLCICELCLDSFAPEDNHCLSCHKTFGAFDDTLSFSNHTNTCQETREVDTLCLHALTSLPLQIRLLKALLTFIEVSIPSVAFHSLWEDYRRTWGMKLLIASSTEDLLQALTVLESGIKRDYLSSNFETTKELLGFCTLSGVVACNFPDSEALPVLPWIPLSTAAILLRLLQLDASISYKQPQKAEQHKNEEKCIDVEPTEACQDDEHTIEDKYIFSNAETDEVANKRRPKTWVQVGGWDCRVIRRKRSENRTIERPSPRNHNCRKWVVKEIRTMQTEDAENSISSEGKFVEIPHDCIEPELEDKSLDLDIRENGRRMEQSDHDAGDEVEGAGAEDTDESIDASVGSEGEGSGNGNAGEVGDFALSDTSSC